MHAYTQQPARTNTVTKRALRGSKPTGGGSPTGGAGPTGGDTPTPQTPTSPERPETAKWQPWTPCAPGERVTHQGVTYTCIQGHTSQPDWEPQVTLALWQRGV